MQGELIRARRGALTFAFLFIGAASGATAEDKPDPLLSLTTKLKNADRVASTVVIRELGVDHGDGKDIEIARSTVHDKTVLITEMPPSVVQALITRYQIQRFSHEAAQSSRELAWLLRKAWIRAPQNAAIGSLVERCDRARDELAEAASAFESDFTIRLMRAQHRLDECDGTVDGRVSK